MPASLRNLMLTILSLLALGQAQAQTEAGSSIENQLKTQYNESFPGNPRSQGFSRTVTTTVLGLCAPRILPDGTVSNPGQVISSIAGSRAILSYTVFNQGNGAFSLPLSVKALDGWTAQSIKIFHDLQNDGAIDPTDPEITAIDLKAGQSARVLVQVQTPFSTSGSAHFDLQALCTDGLGTKTDNGNVGRVTLTAESAVKLDKQMTLTEVRKDDEVTVKLKVTNTGFDDLQNVQVMDRLDQEGLQGMAYVPGSLEVVSGVKPFPGALYFDSGNQAVSVIFDRIPRAGIREVQFKLKVLSAALLGNRVNSAQVQAASSTDPSVLVSADSSFAFKVLNRPEIWLGPLSQPQAAEMTDADMQQGKITAQGKELCMGHTVLNAAQISDVVSIAVESINPDVQVRILSAQGTPLPAEIPLEPTQSLNFQTCYTTSTPTESTFDVVWKATSKLGATPNRTLDRITVQYPPEIWLGPLSLPKAAELTEEDTVHGEILARNLMECLDHTVLNAAGVTDTVTLTLEDINDTPVLNSTDVKFDFYQGTSKLTLPVKFTLPAGGSENFRICYTRVSSKQTPFSVRVVAASDRGGVNRSLDSLSHAVLGPDQKLNLQKSQSVAAGTKLLHGEEYTYTLSLTNKLPYTLTELLVTDLLDPNLDYISMEVLLDGTVQPDVQVVRTELKDEQGKRTATRLEWKIPALDPEQIAEIRFKVKVHPDARDGYVLDNAFTADALELVAPLESNHVQVLLWSTALLLKKEADKKVVEYGDVLNWTLTLTNPASTVTVQDVMLEDLLPRGLVYIPGSTQWKLENAGAANQPMHTAPDPVQQGQLLRWGQSAQSTLPALPAQARLVLTFSTRVTPEVGDEIINGATAIGCGLKDPNLNQCVVTVASNSGGVSTATVQVKSALFKTPALLVGRVYVDRDEDRKYDPAIDQPLKNARVVLSSGRSITTDAEGRYSADGIQTGIWALRLDPFSAPYTPEAMPEDRGKPGSRNLMIAGLTTVDFPLLPSSADVRTFRTTRLQYGPLTVQKTVHPAGNNEYIVTVKLTATQDLPDFQITDLLPEGATLLEGEAAPQFEVLSQGDHLLDYRIHFEGAWSGALTDPQVRWRYP
ncbi:DUF11 domain-containing protein [Deinococcus cellulosilyticus]|uniref:DUF11 domain-containing protein n=1 Tax=Deinococcus cellulosilyticus (strain DSM 18568 / NBRC 106333 / KACC 11606 / 5516J-15) TaxID=1223518 RepID=A0A511MY70_DEIC1|nr:DUF11 domain-containing protein [Deinococcus cellulosilyticus]GEM45238.1 hypothetical protein DC3_08730 [Deinococcus cellulosilyticus NBRC 106333 = KACC 11606]